ncbi:hypothetical protein KHC28_06270 [Ancylobacter sonchi]|uniref:hypothetical protein n=1 Tax=Ancylobacter sonchi TaxID=1937790 RepID=UPI001BD60E53|nr:hypothetical protein [Ancylobacter sonchi]MBS7533261.1 hypothetical protein [Ancylobacter sonchi]
MTVKTNASAAALEDAHFKVVENADYTTLLEYRPCSGFDAKDVRDHLQVDKIRRWQHQWPWQPR